MKTDALLREEAMDVLIDKLGEVDAERFISIIKSDTFDYTEWQRNLWKGKSIDEIYAMAVANDNEQLEINNEEREENRERREKREKEERSRSSAMEEPAGGRELHELREFPC